MFFLKKNLVGFIYVIMNYYEEKREKNVTFFMLTVNTYIYDYF